MELTLVRKNLLVQHESLRGQMRDLEAALDGGKDTAALVKGLRDALAAHNAAEEGVLVPILQDIDAWGPERVQMLLEEHREEHGLFVKQLEPGTPASVLREVLTHLRQHMEHEEKTTLSSNLLRDDVIIVDAD